MINIWVQIIIAVISALISYALRPKPQSAKAPTLDEFSVPQAEEGVNVPVVFGTVWLKAPSVLDYGNLRNEPPIKAETGK